jgi:hypothetical protein
VITAARAPFRSLGAILFAALLALSLIATTVDALAASRFADLDRSGRHTGTGEPREFPSRGITWE